MKRSSRWLMGIIALALVLTACTPEASNEAAPTAEMPEQETMKEQANPTQEESESAGLVQTELCLEGHGVRMRHISIFLMSKAPPDAWFPWKMAWE